MKQKKHLFSDLYREVINTETNCAGCGACVMVCPNQQLVLNNNRPEQVSGGKSRCDFNEGGRCGLCARVCPRLEAESDKETRMISYGDYREILAVRTTDPALKEKCQDGGFAGTILKWGLRKKKWTSCLAYDRDEKWQVVTAVITDPDEVAKTCGSKYTFNSLYNGLSQLKESNHSDSPFAMVGLPCQINAVKKMRELKAKYVRGLAFSVGLFCSESFTYEGLIKTKLVQEMGLSLNDVVKMNIKKGSFLVEMRTGAVHKIPIKEVKEYAHSGCASCSDFAAENADISVGGLGVDDWTVAIIRTGDGEKVFEEIKDDGLIEVKPIDEFPKVLGLLKRLSEWKSGRTK